MQHVITIRQAALKQLAEASACPSTNRPYRPLFSLDSRQAADYESKCSLLLALGLTRQILRRPARACKLSCALLDESLGP